MATARQKLAITLSISILIVLMTIPGLVGSTIQSVTVDALLNSVPSELGQSLEITPARFQRGWFSSDATLEVRYEPLDRLNGEPVTLSLLMDIKHGPVLFTPEGIRLGLAYSAITPTLTGLKLVDLGPEFDQSISSPDFFLFAAFDNTIELDFDLDRVDTRGTELPLYIDGVIGKLTVERGIVSNATIESGELSMRNATGSFDIELSGANIYAAQEHTGQTIATGKAGIVITQVHSTAPLPLTIEKISSDYSLLYTDNSQNQLQLTQLFSINQLDSDIPLDSMGWKLEINQLNRTLLERYLELLKQVQDPSASNPAIMNAQITDLSNELALLIIHEPLEFNITVDLDAYDGTHKLELSANWRGLPDLATLSALDINEAVNAIEVKVEIDADETALAQSPIAPMVEEYLREGLLTVKTGRVYLNGTVTNSTLTINDQVFPLDQFY